MPDAFNVLIKDTKNEKVVEQNVESLENEKVKTEEAEGVKSVFTAFFLFLMFIICFIGSINDQIRRASINTLSLQWDRNGNQISKIYENQQYSPQQLHLSLGVDDTEMYVTWTTMEPSRCRLAYGITDMHLTTIYEYAELTRSKVVEQDRRWRMITRKGTRKLNNYRAKMRKLEPGFYYAYRAECTSCSYCMDYKYFSSMYTYRVRPFSKTSQNFTIAFYGDLGLENAVSVPSLIKSIDNNQYDMVIHNGDFAYDLNTKHGTVGDEFMRLIEPIAARVPYQTSVGNHELAENFTHYDSRFTMINQGLINHGKRNNFYYSFNVGPIHFVAFSTEFYYFVEYSGLEPLKQQYEWLKQDLAHAASSSERSKRPWIIVFGHRPMYCSSNDKDDCTKENNILRKGLQPNNTYALEKLFYDYGVDVQLYSHEHEYERFLPIYNGSVMTADKKTNPYDNPLGPVHIISGSAGCDELIDGFDNIPINGSRVRVSEYGITKILASRCSLGFEQISTQDFEVSGMNNLEDQLVITKTKLANFPQISDIDLDCA